MAPTCANARTGILGFSAVLLVLLSGILSQIMDATSSAVSIYEDGLGNVSARKLLDGCLKGNSVHTLQLQLPLESNGGSVNSASTACYHSDR